MSREVVGDVAEKLEFIPYCLPSISDEERAEVADTLSTTWLTKGPKSVRFEKAFAEYVGCEHAIAVSSCTAALHLAVRVIDIQPGDEVITTPMTFCATTEILEYQNAKPVFVDIDPITFNLDIDQIESKITDRTRAIMPVHYAGIPCDMDKLMAIARRHNLEVIEDAAHAAGTRYKGNQIGSMGNLTCYSFYPTKNMTTGEGGMLTTNNAEYADKARVLSLHGISKDAWKRYSSQGQWFYEVTEMGYKYNFTDIQASLGLQQLKKLDHFNEVREKYARMYVEAFQGLPGINLPDFYSAYLNGDYADQGYYNCWHLFTVLVDDKVLSINRDQFIEELKAKQIGTSVHFIPVHLHPYYADKYGYQRGDFPVTESIYDQTMSIPLYPAMSEDQIHRIANAVREIAEKHLR